MRVTFLSDNSNVKCFPEFILSKAEGFNMTKNGCLSDCNEETHAKKFFFIIHFSLTQNESKTQNPETLRSAQRNYCKINTDKA
ncbi:hypothetical protein C7377_0324 [Balneicella halophila]|uniref:Uncharacterized protein n=1 Tax=Balneicella halophila TaxID=1537566 RepID=A0A7L4UQT1_BALHA|nr:hypothetical protein C7377_0324 [Balneicella halophila]